MSTGLLFDCDEEVANWMFVKYKWPAYKYDKALGLVDSNGVLVGAVFYHSWNGSNVEIAYYGEGTMTLGVYRSLARYAILQFDASRLSAVTSKKNKQLIKGLMKTGFKFEGVSRCYYGKKDTNRNTGVRLVMFRDVLERVGKISPEVDKHAHEPTTR
jgi:RimJ/RimL family protein N-acetyltransferase